MWRKRIIYVFELQAALSAHTFFLQTKDKQKAVI